MQDYSGICVSSTKLLPKLAIYLDAFFKLRLWLLSVNTVKHYGITDDGPTYNVCQISACILKVRLSILQSHQIVVAIYEPLSCYDIKDFWGSGCGSVVRAVAYDTKGPRFESRHRQNAVGCIE